MQNPKFLYQGASTKAFLSPLSAILVCQQFTEHPYRRDIKQSWSNFLDYVFDVLNNFNYVWWITITMNHNLWCDVRKDRWTDRRTSFDEATKKKWRSAVVPFPSANWNTSIIFQLFLFLTPAFLSFPILQFIVPIRLVSHCVLIFVSFLPRYSLSLLSPYLIV